MNCEKCNSENTELVVVTRSNHLLTVVRCKDCGSERLPTVKERSDWL